LAFRRFHAVHAHRVEAQHGVKLCPVTDQQDWIALQQPTKVAKLLKNKEDIMELCRTTILLTIRHRVKHSFSRLLLATYIQMAKKPKRKSLKIGHFSMNAKTRSILPGWPLLCSL
jgi:hypothetical protein